MYFESPMAFLLLIFLPVFLEGGFVKRIWKEPRLRFSTSAALSSIPQSNRLTLRAPTLSLLKVSAFALLVVALARPQSGTHFTETEASGRDIILALDVSGSMQALDFFIEEERVNRLTALKQVVQQFADARKGDRMGLVVFGDNAFTQCPLTLDSDVLKNFVSALEVGMAGKGTAIGNAIAISLKQIQEIESESKVIILVTDGKNTSGDISPTEAARIARKLGVKIHSIGIGGKEPALFPTTGIFGNQTFTRVPVVMDEKALQEISAITGGSYFNATDTSGLESVYNEINKLEQREDKIFEYVEYDEEYLPLAATGFCLFLVYALLSSTVFLRIP